MNDRIKMPFKKGKKYYIEIEAIEDGDLFNTDIINLIFGGMNITPFKINELIHDDIYFTDKMKKMITDKMKKRIIEAINEL